jgi:basic amino acid/polyamine antiporter, APA family
MTELKRSLGLWQCVFFGVGSILGAGIYVLIGKVAGLAGNFSWLAFLVSSVAAFLTALSYAELSSMYPKAGGEFEYAKHAFGRRMGAAIGLIVSSNGILVAAAVAIGFAGYFIQFLDVGVRPAAWALLGLVFLFNVIGIRASSGVNLVLTIVEIAGLGVVVYAAAPTLGSVNYLELPEPGVHGIFMAASLAFFAYVGFEEVVKLAEETKNPERTIPRALMIAGVLVTVIYMTIAVLAVSALPWNELAESHAPLADIVRGSLGETGAIIVAIAALFSTTNTVLSNMLGSSRVLYDMGRETRPLRAFAYVLPGRKTPLTALIVVLLLCLALASIAEIGTVAEFATFAIFVTFFAVNLALIVLRVREPRTRRPFRLPLAIRNVPVSAIAAIAMILGLLAYNIYAIAS